jgi:hypothetical protein
MKCDRCEEVFYDIWIICDLCLCAKCYHELKEAFAKI